jgi:hypothetical protein
LTNIGRNIKYNEKYEACKDVISYIFSQIQETIVKDLRNVIFAYNTDSDINKDIVIRIKQIYNNKEDNKNLLPTPTLTLQTFVKQGIVNKEHVQKLVHTFYKTIRPKTIIEYKQYDETKINAEIKCIIDIMKDLINDDVFTSKYFEYLSIVLVEELKKIIVQIVTRENTCNEGICSVLKNYILGKFNDNANANDNANDNDASLATVLKLIELYDPYIKIFRSDSPNIDKIIKVTLINIDVVQLHNNVINPIKPYNKDDELKEYVKFMLWAINICITEKINDNVIDMIEMKDKIIKLLKNEQKEVMISGILKNSNTISPVYYPVMIYKYSKEKNCQIDNELILSSYYEYLTKMNNASAKQIIYKIESAIKTTNINSVDKLPTYSSIVFVAEQHGGTRIAYHNDQYYVKYMKYKAKYLAEKRRM